MGKNFFRSMQSSLKKRPNTEILAEGSRIWVANGFCHLDFHFLVISFSFCLLQNHFLAIWNIGSWNVNFVIHLQKAVQPILSESTGGNRLYMNQTGSQRFQIILWCLYFVCMFIQWWVQCICTCNHRRAMPFNGHYQENAKLLSPSLLVEGSSPHHLYLSSCFKARFIPPVST